MTKRKDESEADYRERERVRVAKYRAAGLVQAVPKRDRRERSRACYARKAAARWRARYAVWLGRLRAKYGDGWTPGPGVGTWRKWRNRQMIRIGGKRSRMVRGSD